MPQETIQMLMSLGWIALTFVLFYFVLIRPQKKREKEVNHVNANTNNMYHVICHYLLRIPAESRLITSSSDLAI